MKKYKNIFIMILVDILSFLLCLFINFTFNFEYIMIAMVVPIKYTVKMIVTATKE